MKFQFKAIRNNQNVSGKIEANNQNEAIELLKTRGYFPYSVVPLETQASQYIDDFLNRVTFNDIVNLTRQLAIMLHAGLTLIDSIDIFKKQTEKAPLIRLLEEVDKKLKSGKSFSTALQDYPEHFSTMYVALVKSGEASGKLSSILFNLAENLERRRDFVNKIRGALVYPSIILLGMFIIIFILLTFVIPQLTALYLDLEVDLPLFTQILVAVSSFLSDYWLYVLLGLIAAVIFGMRTLKNRQTKYAFDLLLMKTPVIKKVYSISTLVNAIRTLSILISSGVSLLEGIEITIKTTNNLPYQHAFRKVKKEVEQGVSLGTAMEKQQVFPPILIQMTAVGEQTGNLDSTLKNIAQYFETESELAIKTATTLIEPAILIVMGVVVGFIVVAVITPIYSLTNTLQ